MPRAARRCRSRRAFSSAESSSSPPAENLLGGQEHALVAGLAIELVEVLDERSRAGAQEEHRRAVGRDRRARRPAEREAIRLGVLAEEVFVFGADGNRRRDLRGSRLRLERR